LTISTFLRSRLLERYLAKRVPGVIP